MRRPYGVPMATVVARGVVKSFGSGRAARRVLDGVDLEVQAGELVSIVGRSGSGKSTLLHVLGGLERPDAGSVAIDGERLEDLGERALGRLRARRVGFVFQFFHLVPELTGADNVALPARLPGAPSGGRRRAARLVSELGLDGVAGSLPHTLSGGEQQRFAIARALVNDPVVVLADEPTGNLDRAAAEQVVGLLADAAGRGCAVLVATHDAEIGAAASRVLTLRDGRLSTGSTLSRGGSR
jgi:ABC-type lipoprotein export system ATPase subunit